MVFDVGDMFHIIRQGDYHIYLEGSPFVVTLDGIFNNQGEDVTALVTTLLEKHPDEFRVEMLKNQTKDVSKINHPKHYNKNGIECIDCIKTCVDGYSGIEGFYIGNIIKYLYRANEKGQLESLKKAQWYMNALIEEYQKKESVAHEQS